MKLSQLTIGLLIINATLLNAQQNTPKLPKQDTLKKSGKQPLGVNKKTGKTIEPASVKTTDENKCNKCGKG